MKVINLDKISTRREKVVVLDGIEHVMHVPTVKDYIEQMTRTEEIINLANSEGSVETASKMLELTLQTLTKSFPTIPVERLRGLNMDQLNALRELADDTSSDDAPSEDQGEAVGETE